MNKIHNEKKLFNKIRKKDKVAFIQAYDLYIDDIYRFIYFKVSTKEEAEDIASTVFLKTWNYIQNQKIKKSKSLKALLYTISRNLVIDYYRTKKTELSINDENNNIDIVDEKQNIIKNIELSSDFDFIKTSLLKIKSEYQEVILMKFIDELSFSEMAQVLNKSKGNIRVLTHRAIEALRNVSVKNKKT